MKCPGVLNVPQTEAGSVCDTAANACIVQDMAGARVDVPAAISVAGSLGVEPATAAPLIMQAAKGMDEGAAERRSREEAAKDKS